MLRYVETLPRGTAVKAAATLFAIGIGLAAALIWLVFDPNVPKGTSVTLALIALLPVAVVFYCGVAIVYFAATGSRIAGAGRFNSLAARITRPL